MSGVQGPSGDPFPRRDVGDAGETQLPDEAESSPAPLKRDSISSGGGAKAPPPTPADASTPLLHLPQGDFDPDAVAQLIQDLEPLSRPTASGISSASEQEADLQAIFQKLLHLLQLTLIQRRQEQQVEEDLEMLREDREGPAIKDLIVEADGRVQSISEEEFQGLPEPGARMDEIAQLTDKALLSILDAHAAELQQLRKGPNPHPQKLLHALHSYVTDLTGAVKAKRISTAVVQHLVHLLYAIDPGSNSPQR